MQLMQTKQYQEPSTAHYDIDFLITQYEEECSVFRKPTKEIEILGRFYIFSNPIEVKRFLLTHDYLIDPLFEAYWQIIKVFGENIVEVCLEYGRDPEEDFEGLSVIVKTNLSPDQSLDLLDKFDEEWWLDVEDRIRTVLSIMVRPV